MSRILVSCSKHAQRNSSFVSGGSQAKGVPQRHKDTKDSLPKATKKGWEMRRLVLRQKRTTGTNNMLRLGKAAADARTEQQAKEEAQKQARSQRATIAAVAAQQYRSQKKRCSLPRIRKGRFLLLPTLLAPSRPRALPAQPEDAGACDRTHRES